MLRNYDDVKPLDIKNGNTLWQNALRTELDQLDEYETFRNLGCGTRAPDDHKMICLHLVFDCKHDFQRKARMVAGGHLNGTPTHTTYSSDVSLRSL